MLNCGLMFKCSPVRKEGDKIFDPARRTADKFRLWISDLSTCGGFESAYGG